MPQVRRQVTDVRVEAHPALIRGLVELLVDERHGVHAVAALVEEGAGVGIFRRPGLQGEKA